MAIAIERTPVVTGKAAEEFHERCNSKLRGCPIKRTCKQNKQFDNEDIRI
jgi:hypothetical protein